MPEAGSILAGVLAIAFAIVVFVLLRQKKQSNEVIRSYEKRYQLVLDELQNRFRDNQQLNASLLAQAELRDQFLSVVSHELKTPLTSLKLGLELLERRSILNTREEANVRRLSQAVVRMEFIIKDLMNVTSHEEIMAHLRSMPLDVVALAKDCVLVHADLSRRSVELVSSETSLNIEADPAQLAQLFNNLLSNAIKFSDPTTPVRMLLRAQGEELLIEVEDQGPGIPPEEQYRIYERFYRVPGTRIRTGSSEGFGVGLFVSKKIVDLHQGRIWVDSRVGEGSRFFVKIPMVPARGSLAERHRTQHGAASVNG